jgi:outer membrane protein assembly factor BamB
MNAIRIAKKYVRKIHPYHEVIVSFDKKAGFCKGNSLGTALTLAFVEELLKTYNSPVVIKVGDAIAFTGGMNKVGRITNTSEEIIKQKTELVFFSNVTHFAVPKAEEAASVEQLNELKQEYPKRDLKIIGIEDLNDLLNRRNLVEIKKQPVIVRGGKFVRKNWVNAVIVIILTMILSFVFVLDFNDNPAILTSEESILYIKNKNGKILWTKKVGAEISYFTVGGEHSLHSRICDVNSDNENEVLISNEISTLESEKFIGLSLKCYNKTGFLLWEYSFQDSVKSDREILSPYYDILIIDTVDVYGQKNIILISRNTSSFSSAIYRLDAKTGRRLPGTLWCSGHTYNAIIKDLNEDGKKDVLAVGVDNGFEQQAVFAFQIDSLTKVRPSTVDYTINDFPFADLISYIRIPKTDFTNYVNLRIPGIGVNSLYDDVDEKVYRFAICINYEPEGGRVWMKLGYSLIDFDIVIDNQFRVLRDSLVVKGQLDLPFTDTQEYKKIIKSNIRYWENGKWVKREELELVKR